ncbi:glycosidase [Kaistella flava (ex Peng et al. 2021)]|uniref:Glycosidase n=1 Tax=Kaistella flava (ex Peng et al. 2021) TaxID=2038776 RepID=A0A7M2YEF3_9FLAO|nr:glycosidase [Kaistella flava (ex Peng et al. 2021)]QOW11852.1 glycosidase [Kaistella flava (ex Peng et al. 2021)]
MIPFQLHRICTIMKPEEGNELEVEGVLNPAVTRGPDGNLYLFPRLVAKNNYSRIGIAKVIFNKEGDPVDVERLGVVLEPETDYEKRPNGGGGCEDPRITYVEPVEHYIMTYTAYGPNGPRIAMARSKDLFTWERMGLICYTLYKPVDFNNVNDKDASFFPVELPSPHNHQSIAMLHRPLFPDTIPEATVKLDKDRNIDKHKESIWISYFNLKEGKQTSLENAKFTSHYRLASPENPWENLKIGAGAPPVLTKHGWMLVYHGVHKREGYTKENPKYCYSAGVMILSEKEPQKILYRSAHPILTPELPSETIGTVGDVVFPTGTDRRDDIGQPNRIDVYYGMADDRIGVAKMIIPESLPEN